MATWICRFPAAGSGLRVGVKDLIDVAGSPTTSGSKVIAASAAPAAADAACLAGTRTAEAAGQVTIVGKTNLNELAFGVTGINPWYGTPVNPLDASLVPGGSSSGSAVAVATGEADVTFGSDTGGSIRVPAACCGIVGLKTTRGRVSLQGVQPLAPSLDTVGPMAASVALTAEGMRLLEPGFTVEGHGAARLIGRFRPPADGWIDEGIDAALAAYANASGSGVKVLDIDLPGWVEATHAVMTILSAEAWGVHSELWLDQHERLSPDVAARLELASLLEPAEVAAAWETARDWHSELAAAFRTVDVIALPVLGGEPPPIADAGRLTDIRYVAPFNLSGTPALAQPVAGPGRLPPSLQLTGPPRSEERLLATGAEIERVAGWGAG